MNAKKALIGSFCGISILGVCTIWTWVGWLSEANMSCMPYTEELTRAPTPE